MKRPFNNQQLEEVRGTERRGGFLKRERRGEWDREDIEKKEKEMYRKRKNTQREL